VERNAGMALELAGRSKQEIAARVREVLALAGLEYEEFHGRYPWQLSGGQRQRVGLARALATDPMVLLMDEPFGALDPLTRDEMQELVLKLLRDAPRTLLMVTHDLNEALRLATRIVLMDKGEVVVDVPANEFSRSTEPMVQKYLRAFRPATAEAAHG